MDNTKWTMDNAGTQKTFDHSLGAWSSLKIEAHRPVRRLGFRNRALRLRTFTFFILLWLSFSLPAAAQTEQQTHRLSVIVVDNNGVPVVSARITLARDEAPTVLKGETDHAGRREFTILSPGLYRLSAEKEGFYAARLDAVRVGETEELEIRLHHELEVRETIDVVYSPPAIDPDKTAISENLSSREITNLPYPTTRDFRHVLPFIPGVLPDATGQVHINGSATHQIHNRLDGFNITHPANGQLELRVSPDALREISVQSSRYSAEYGKGSGGVLSLATGMGDDRFRFSATDFIPSFQTRRGVNLNGWTPRATVSGPLRKGRAWFFDALDGEYNLDIINELLAGADRNHAWRLNNLAKAQVNLNQGNILTTSLLVNYFHADHAGLSRLNPLETTREQRQTAFLFTLKDQAYLAGGLLLELGFGANQFRTDERPLGSLAFVISPMGTSGNYFKTSEGVARRLQWKANLFLPSVRWHGQHEFKVGFGLDRITYEQMAERRTISIRRQDATLAREIAFSARPRFARNNFEVNGFAQDRWAISDRWLVEGGLRLDWDEIIRRVLLSPRLASSYLLTRRGDTRIAFGVGFFYDATNLDFITRPLAGQRMDQLYARDGQTPRGAPVETSFHASERDLRAPRFLNWSVGLERRLPGTIYLRLEFVEKRGRHGFTFVNQSANPSGQTKARFELRNDERDRYDGVTLTLRQTFKDRYEWFASYTRSSARSNAVFDFSLDNVLFSPQTGGPLPWDAPNRLLSWGWLPLIKGFDLAYSLDWRDGYPFSLINQDQQLVGAPNARRFPVYFSLNLHAERRFRLAGFHWALRAGFNNVTNRQNAAEVNNNVDSPQFLTFGSTQGRTFVGRIRLLGRK
jgi:hypothetical protein